MGAGGSCSSNIWDWKENAAVLAAVLGGFQLALVRSADQGLPTYFPFFPFLSL